VAKEEQLEWEARAARPAALAAFAAIALLLGYIVVQQAVALRSRPHNSHELLPTIHKESSAWVASSVLQGLSLLSLAVVLWYLFRVTRHRRPELPSWAVYVIFLGPVLLAVAGVLSALDQLDVADRFLRSGVRSEKRADDLLRHRGGAGVGLGAAGGLGVALSLVLVNINAMRAGLLSRFLGVTGIAVGALQVLPVVPPFILEIFWLGAVGLLFLDRWPGGRGRAWESGEVVPWPTAAERAEQRAGGPVAANPPPGEEPEQPRPASRKRKRKKRR
jgi:Domain of unknown function (DUF4386)